MNFIKKLLLIGMGIIGFKLEDDKLISVDGEITYIRYQE